MKKRVFYVVCAVLIMIGILGPGRVLPVSAQPPEPEVHHEIDFQREPCVAGRPCQDENGYWYLTEDPDLTGLTRNELRAIGDTDEYGYTLSTAAYSWIDAVSSGTNTGIMSSYEQVGPIPLPFNFPFYENTYYEIYIAGPGYLTFSDQWMDGQSEIPDSNEPNNVIAPYWAPNDYPNEGGTGQAYYMTGGVAPDRYFLVEYYRMSDMWGGLFTFEVLLFENGDIKFQYQIMDPESTRWSSEAGIENISGDDGLSLGIWQDYYNFPQSYTAVKFTRPDPMARTKVNPLYQGDFTFASELDEFIFTVTNTGDLGSDTYDLDVTIAPGGSSWAASLHDPGTGDPLTDTGALAQGESKDVLAKVTAPAGAAAGEGVKILIDVTSSLDPTRTKTVTLESTVPAAFTQAYLDYSDGQLSNEIINPAIQYETNVTSYGYYPAVVETPDSTFVNVYVESEWLENDAYGYNLKYAVVDRLGNVIKPPSELSSLYGEPESYTYMSSPSLAVTPDGNVGILWTRYIETYDQNQYYNNYNNWFAVVDSNGNLVYGPTNLTNNYQWGNYQSGYLFYGNTKIEASADNRFMLAWAQGFYAQYYSDADVYYMIRNSNGAAITGGINMTADVENADDYEYLSLTALSGNKFYVFYDRYIDEGYYYYLYPKYRVIDSSGNLAVGETDANLPRPWIEDSIQLPGGNIVLVHEYYDYDTDTNFAGYTILSGSNYNVLNFGTLSHPSASDVNPNTLAVTKTPDGRAIITWMDEDYEYLYYALLHVNGTVLSGPVIFNAFEYGASINREGYAITTNSWAPSAEVDTMAEFQAPLYGGAPGGIAPVQLSAGNQGLTTATSVELTLTLPAGLSYSYDTSGITPSVVGDTVTWTLPDLDFGDVGHFSVYVEIPPEAAVGTFYDLSLEITSTELDIDLSNNTDTCQVMAAELLFLPMTIR